MKTRDEIETKKPIRRINKTKCWFFEKKSARLINLWQI
jgi:hypothetical protein